MKGRTIVLDHLNGHEAAARLVDGRLDDLLIDSGDHPRPGAIYRAICDRPMKGQGGMMVRLTDGETGFLRHGKGLRPGQPILVQITGYGLSGKAIPVTDRILFKPSSGVRVLDYLSVPQAQHSDHRPVFGVFRVNMEGSEIPTTKPRKRKRRPNNAARSKRAKEAN